MKIVLRNIIKLSSIVFISLIVVVFASTEISNASKYITKKSKTSEETEQIDKMYADGLLTKSECIKAKTIVLKLKKEVKTICDNVVVKKAKKVVKKEKILASKWNNDRDKYPFNKYFYNLRDAKDFFKNKKLNDLVHLSLPKYGEEKDHWDNKYPKWIEANYTKFKAWSESSDGAWGWRTSGSSQLDAVKLSLEKCNSFAKDKDCVVVKVQDRQLTYKEQDEWLKKIYGKTTLAVKLIEENLSSTTYVAKKEHKEKKKDLSKEATSYITKKKTKTKHYEAIAELPDSELYFYAVDEKNLFYIGFVNQDEDSKLLTVGNRKFRKGNKGRAYISDGKTNCSVYSEVDENAQSEKIYTGTAIINCTDKRYFIGNWVQRGELGKGIAIDEDGTALEFNFSMNRKIAMASFDKIKKGDTKIAKIIDEPDFKPDKTVKKRFKPKIITKLEIVSKETCFSIKGNITNKDYPSSKEFFMEIDGDAINNKKGNFSEKRCSLKDKEYFVRATNEYGEFEEVVVKVKIKRDTKIADVPIENLNPSKNKIRKNPNRLAVIIGIEKYKETAKASFAKKDAEWFKEYAQNAFGVTENNIKMLLDEEATLTNSNTAFFLWLKKKIIPNRSELIIFFSGHGLANEDGTELYMLAQNSHPDALEYTAILRTEMVKEIKSFEPKSVTMFFDTCYSGETREKGGYLVASTKGLKPIKVESEFPENFTVFTSSQNDQSSSGLPKAKHGIFSYLLMKGLEGKADANKDGKITNGELFAYLESNVKEKAISIWGREQDPSFFGKKNKVLLKY